MRSRASELPEYLGFGWLDPGSIQQSNSGLTAHYVDERARPAYVIRADGASTELAEQWNGQRIRLTRAPTLQAAAAQHAMAETKLPLSPRWLELEQRVSEQAYFHVFDGGTGPDPFGMVFFPAMHLMRLWVPRANDLGDVRIHLPDASAGSSKAQNTRLMLPERERVSTPVQI